MASRQNRFVLSLENVASARRVLITLPILEVVIYILVSIDEAEQHRSIKNDKLHYYHLESSILRVQLCHFSILIFVITRQASNESDQCNPLERHFQGTFTPMYIRNSAVHQ